MRGHAIAQRYAKALFDIGADAGDATLDRVQQTLAALAETISASPELTDMLRSPVISATEKEQALAHLLTLLAPDLPESESRMLKNFCSVLAEKNRLPLFSLIAEAFSAMLDSRRQIVRGSLRTAIELDDAKRSSIKNQLEKSLDGTLDLDYQVDPSILGGMTLKLGNRMLDASLRTQLEALRDTIKKGE